MTDAAATFTPLADLGEVALLRDAPFDGAPGVFPGEDVANHRCTAVVEDELEQGGE